MSFPDLFKAFEDFPIVVFVYVKNYFHYGGPKDTMLAISAVTNFFATT